MSKAPIRTTIQKDGQPYIDEEIVARPVPPDLIGQSLSVVFKRALPERIVLGHERVQLRWLKRAADGSLVPR